MISLLLPTRNRLPRARAFLRSIVDTATDLSSVEVVVAIDSDDPSSLKLHSPHPALKLVKTIAPHTTMGGLNSRCLKHASGSILMLVNDDIQIRTRGWDQIMLQSDREFKDQIYLMHTRDGFRNEKFPIFPIISRRCAAILQDPFPPLFTGDGIDAHLFDLFLRLKDKGEDRIRYLPNVFFEHLHHALGKSEFDKTYATRSHTSGNHTFYSLWAQREQDTKKLYQEIQKEGFPQTLTTSQTQTLPAASTCPRACPCPRALSALFGCFLHSKQSLTYRLKYLCYHLTRELYITLGLNRLKAALKKRIP